MHSQSSLQRFSMQLWSCPRICRHLQQISRCKYFTCLSLDLHTDSIYVSAFHTQYSCTNDPTVPGLFTSGIVTVVSPIGPRWFCQQSLNCGAAFVSLRSPDLKSTKDDSQGVWAQGRQESRIYRQGTGEQLRRKLKGLLRGTLCLFKTIKNTVRTTVEG